MATFLDNLCKEIGSTDWLWNLLITVCLHNFYLCSLVYVCMIPFVIVLRQLDSHFASTVFVFLLSQWLIEVCSVYCLFVKVWYVCSDIFIHLM